MVLSLPFDDQADRADECLTLQAAKGGDRAAFELIVRRHERMVLRTAVRLLSNHADAADAAQEVLLRLHRALSTFDDEREFPPWLYRVTVNVCHDLRRRTRGTASLELVREYADGAPSPERNVTDAEMRDRLYRALDTLPAKERAALVLRDLEGLTTAEVARVLESSEATVRSQISSARLKLRAILTRKGGRP